MEPKAVMMCGPAIGKTGADMPVYHEGCVPPKSYYNDGIPYEELLKPDYTEQPCVVCNKPDTGRAGGNLPCCPDCYCNGALREWLDKRGLDPLPA